MLIGSDSTANFKPDFNYFRGRFSWHFSELYTRYTGYSVVLSFLLFQILLWLYVELAHFIHAYENSSHFPMVSLFSPVSSFKQIERENDE